MEAQTRPSTKHSQRTRTPIVQITSEDADDISIAESFDSSLPQTPTGEEDSRMGNLEARSRRSSIISSLGTIEEPTDEMEIARVKSGSRSREGSPGCTRSNNSRLTPAEKLEKLIEVYEGTCSYDEYEKYVRPEEEEKGTEVDDYEEEGGIDEKNWKKNLDEEMTEDVKKDGTTARDVLTAENEEDDDIKDNLDTATQEQAHVVPKERDEKA